jgi:hypothetical protein
MLFETMRIVFFLPSKVPYSVMYCQGPWFRFIIDFMLLSPLITILAVSFIFYSFINKGVWRDYKLAYFLLMFLVVFCMSNMFSFQKNVRYVISLDFPLRLFALYMLKELLKNAKSASKLVFLAVLCLFIIDYAYFVYAQPYIGDTISKFLLESRKIIP